MPYDPLSAAIAASIGGVNPQGMANFTQGLNSLGFMGTPGASPLMNFQDLEGFQRSLKNIFDIQMQGYPGAGTPNFNWGQMPTGMRNMYTAGLGLMEDPMYGIMGTNAMMRNGYVTGALPNYHTPAYETYFMQNNQGVGAAGNDWSYYPIAHPPMVVNSAGGGGGGGGGGGSHTGSYKVGLQGGGDITVNASDPQAAITNANAQTHNKASTNVTQVG